MTIQDLKEQGLIVLECISGSRAYGLELPHSDTDIKGVFVLPKSTFFGLDYIPQVSNESNDIVYYELGRFIDLLGKNNPNILELLATPEDKILYKHPLMNQVSPEVFLSKLCKDSFGGYAFTQIKKARGLKKKIVNPIDKVRKTILSFCYILQGNDSISLEDWLSANGLHQEECGLVNMPHAQGMFGLYADKSGQLGYKGVLRKETANEVLLSSIPKSEKLLAYLYFNQDGYTKYCKDYKAYWDWVEQRNEERYQNNVEHGKNYDSKNMMHTFRLLEMAKEILELGEIHVKRPNREELLSIRKGDWQYDDLITQSEEKMKQVETAYQNSLLPEKPDMQVVERLLVDLRNQFYEIENFF